MKQYPSLTSSKAHNWVDRGKPAEPVIARILANYLHRHDDAEDDWRLQHAATIMGMVAADASEVQVAGYLRSIARELQYPPGEPRGTRIFAVAAWHAAKAALVRDFAERVLRHEIPPNYPTPEPLADWLAARLLTPEELEQWAAEAEAGDSEQEKP